MTMTGRLAGMLPFALMGMIWASAGGPSRAQTGSMFLLDLPGDRVGVLQATMTMDSRRESTSHLMS